MGMALSQTHIYAETILGIDLGASKAVAAVYHDGSVRVVPPGPISSCVSFTPTEILVGDEVGRSHGRSGMFCGVKKVLGMNFTGSKVQDFFRRIGAKVISRNATTVDETLPQGKRRPFVVIPNRENLVLAPEELVAMVLRQLKTNAEEFVGERIRKAVIAVPGYFLPSQRQSVVDAAYMADLEVARLINDPTATAVSELVSARGEAKNYVVVDVGSTALQASVMTVENGIFEVLSSTSDVEAAGDASSRRLLQYVQKELRRLKKEKQLQNIPLKTMSLIREQIDEAKHALASVEKYSIDVPINGTELSISITRDLFSDLHADFLRKATLKIQTALDQAHILRSEIEQVFVVGGFSRMHRVHQTLKEYMSGVPVTRLLRGEESVALGAAYMATYLSGAAAAPLAKTLNDLTVLEVMPNRLSIDNEGGLLYEIAAANSLLPLRVEHMLTNAEASQHTMDVAVYSGNRPNARDCVVVGRYHVRGIPPVPENEARIKLMVVVDVSGLVEVFIEDETPSAVKEKSLLMGDTFNLDRETVFKMADRHVKLLQSSRQARVTRTAAARSNLEEATRNRRNRLVEAQQRKGAGSATADAIDLAIKVTTGAQEWLAGVANPEHTSLEEYEAMFDEVTSHADAVLRLEFPDDYKAQETAQSVDENHEGDVTVEDSESNN
jgi:molecular chaperone DnaK (HSP70)